MTGHGNAVALGDGLDDRGVAARALGIQEMDLVHGDELLGDGARELAPALVIAHHHRHLGSAEPREALAGAEGHREIRIVVVDDILDGLAGPQVLLAEAREVAGQGQDLADEHLLDVRGRHGPVGEDGHDQKARQCSAESGHSLHRSPFRIETSRIHARAFRSRAFTPA
jgi:hypothetical protein